MRNKTKMIGFSHWSTYRSQQITVNVNTLDIFQKSHNIYVTFPECTPSNQIPQLHYRQQN